MFFGLTPVKPFCMQTVLTKNILCTHIALYKIKGNRHVAHSFTSIVDVTPERLELHASVSRSGMVLCVSCLENRLPPAAWSGGGGGAVCNCLSKSSYIYVELTQ